MSFTSLGLSEPLLKIIQQQGYSEPSPVQKESIPIALAGRDLLAAAQTGTGKTAGFTLPVLQRLAKGQKAGANSVRALIITPTRELAAQVNASVETYGQNLDLTSAVVFGGVKINPQMMKLRRGVDILVATPGRLLDLYNKNALHFKKLEILVLDEADRMLDMGFIHDIKKVLAVLPKQRQNLLFSATFSPQIRKLAKGLVNNPVEISVTPRNTTATTVTQWIHPVDKKRKAALLAELIKSKKWHQVLVFSRTKRGANKLSAFLNDKGINAAPIHGNKSQAARTKALAGFKNGKVQVLVATDIAARGIDIDQLPQVVNFDLPDVAEDYVHRIGRTGRAGSTGTAISLVCADQVKQLSDIEHFIKRLLDRQLVDGFEPEHDVPVTSLDKRIAAPKQTGNGGNRRGGNRNQGRRGNSNNSQPNTNAKKRRRRPRKPKVATT
ncbi:MAG: DEAD/DEAH box helicase [Thiotrichaceae bacterium]|nr:DEAD/DEAH box helicase [Thiotrichaceae bacterium]